MNRYSKGHKLGNCTYIEETLSAITDSGRYVRKALFICECGNEFEASIDAVKCKNTKSCGCFQKAMARKANKTHGLSSHPLYSTWKHMTARCIDPKESGFKHYGARGISVCDLWNNNIKAFIDYVTPLPNALQPGYSIDRIDNDGNYEPGNVRWATQRDQTLNSRLRVDNKTGHRGIFLDKRTGKYRVNIKTDRYVHVGYFVTLQDAIEAKEKFIKNNLSDNMY